MTAIKRYNQSAAAVFYTPSDLSSSKSVMLADPTGAEDETIFFTDSEITISSIRAVLVGSATPSVTWTVRYASDRSAAGTEVVTGGTTTTSVSSGSNVTTFNNGTIPADRWVWLETTAQSGTVTELAVTVRFGTPVTDPGGGDISDEITWTPIPDLDASDREVYVSATGSDAHTFGYDYGDGTFQGQITRPFLTLASALAALRDGHGDRLLLKKGDTWTDQNFGDWPYTGGVSNQRPIIVGAYGTGARPLIQTGTSNGITMGMYWASGPCGFIWFIGLEFTAHSYTGSGTPRGVNMNGNFNDVLFEDCCFHNYYHGMTLNGFGGPSSRHTNITVRGCTVYNTYTNNAGDHAQGIYCALIDGLLIEYCNLWRCGWGDNPALFTIYRHSAYLQSGMTDVTFRHNITAQNDGVQLRPGGVASGNVFSRLTAAFVSGASATLEDNVILEGIDSPGGGASSWGLVLEYWASGGVIARNIIANSIGTNAGQGIQLTDMHGVGIYENIVSNWGGVAANVQGSLYDSNTWDQNVLRSPDNAVGSGPMWSSSASTLNSTDFALSGSVFVPNSGDANIVNNGGTTYTSGTIATWFTLMGDSGSTTTDVSYVDDTLTLGGYYSSIGGTSDHDDCMTAIIGQSKDDWDVHLTAPAIIIYMKAGFTEV